MLLRRPSCMILSRRSASISPACPAVGLAQDACAFSLSAVPSRRLSSAHNRVNLLPRTVSPTQVVDAATGAVVYNAMGSVAPAALPPPLRSASGDGFNVSFTSFVGMNDRNEDVFPTGISALWQPACNDSGSMPPDVTVDGVVARGNAAAAGASRAAAKPPPIC